MSAIFQHVLHAIQYNRFILFFGIVWRPISSDVGDSWLRSWIKYRMDISTAWAVANIIYQKDASK